jgi:hypothetical protein
VKQPDYSIKAWKQQVARSKTRLGYNAWVIDSKHFSTIAATRQIVEEKWRCRYDDCDGLLEVNSDYCSECERLDLRKAKNDSFANLQS